MAGNSFDSGGAQAVGLSVTSGKVVKRGSGQWHKPRACLQKGTQRSAHAPNAMHWGGAGCGGLVNEALGMLGRGEEQFVVVAAVQNQLQALVFADCLMILPECLRIYYIVCYEF